MCDPSEDQIVDTEGVTAAAYGFRIEGIADAGGLALQDAHSWPVLSVECQLDPDPGPPGARVTEGAASIQTPAGCLQLDRAKRAVTIRARQPVEEAALIHPCLWPAAAVFARWAGAETLHAGAFITARGAWAVLGERGSGKSTLLASLAITGESVIADDLIVLDGLDCFAGPRCIDLRPAAARALDVEDDTVPVRSTLRRRLSLPPAVGRVPLLGFVQLGWEERTAVRWLGPSERFALIARHRRVAALGADLDLLLDLAGLPALVLGRPRAWGTLADVRGALMEAVGTAGG